MGLILYAKFFLYFIVAVNHADAAAAGDACTTAVQCDGDLLCDQIHNKCLIKVPESCVGSTDKCVSHAICGTGDLCACETGYTNNAGLCEANVGTACNASVGCIATSVCDNVFGKCLIKVPESCAGNTDKCVSHAVCGTGDLCACDTGYTVNAGLCDANIGTVCNASVNCVDTSVCDNLFGKCLVKDGSSCAAPNVDKCVSHATCTGGSCGCNTEYAANAEGLCEAKVGTACNASVDCITTSVCDNVFGKCLVKHGASCAAPNTDKCVSHATCTSNLCGCNDGYTSNTAGLCDANVGTPCNASVGCIAPSVCDNVFGKCLVKHGASCAAPNTDKCVSHAACTNNLCGCNDGYTSNTAGLCEANIGTACNVSVRCVTSYVCDNVSGKCLIKAGASCADIDKCVSNATCQADSTCGCRNGYTDNEEGLCVLQTNNKGRTPGISTSALVCMLLSGMCLTILMM